MVCMKRRTLPLSSPTHLLQLLQSLARLYSRSAGEARMHDLSTRLLPLLPSPRLTRAAARDTKYGGSSPIAVPAPQRKAGHATLTAMARKETPPAAAAPASGVHAFPA